MHKLRLHIKDLFADMLPEPRVIEDVTGKGAKALRSTPLWPGGPATQAFTGITRVGLPTSAKETRNRAWVWNFWPTD